MSALTPAVRRHLEPRRLAGALLLLAVATEFKFRERDATLAISGAIDAQIMFELAVWAAVAAWVGLHVIRGPRPERLFVPRSVGPAQRIVLAICLLGILSSLPTGSPLAVVRSLQYTIMAFIIIIVWHRVRQDDESVAVFWITMRRMFLGLALAATVGSLLFNGLPGVTFTGYSRYAWFTMHPIHTAVILGLTFVLLAGAFFGLPDPWLDRPRRWLLAGAVSAPLAVAMLLTKARGALGGALVGVAVVGMLSRHRVRRGVTVLGVLLVASLLIFGVGQQAVVGVAVRGQTAEQVLSLTGRTELFKIAAELFAEEPVLGHGFQSGRGVFLERVPWAGEAHNFLIEIAISTGLVGLLLWLWLLARMARVLITMPRRLRWTVKGLVVRDTAGLLAFVVVAGMVGSGAADNPGFEWLALLLAALASDLISTPHRSGASRADPAAGIAQHHRPVSTT